MHPMLSAVKQPNVSLFRLAIVCEFDKLTKYAQEGNNATDCLLCRLADCNDIIRINTIELLLKIIEVRKSVSIIILN